MKSEFDLVMTASAVCVAAYVAIALECTVYYLGLSPQEIRSAAVSIAVIVAVLIAIDFFGRKLGKAE